MTNQYQKTIDYLFSRFPNYQASGGKAINFGLGKMREVCDWLGNPQDHLKIIHIAGTNGKGSSASMISAIMTASGYRSGLFTSPHLLDFRERIRIDGQVIPQEEVTQFVADFQSSGIEGATFFEISAAMSLWYFHRQQVDVAVIETGLGGRLDATNVVTPIATLITQIGLDHQAFLGDTLALIAREKAGIIKPQVPVVVSGLIEQEVKAVFEEVAQTHGSPIWFALQLTHRSDLPLQGQHQQRNLAGVLKVIELSRSHFPKISLTTIDKGLEHVLELSGLRGRWEKLGDQPAIFADVSHNPNGVKETLDLVAQQDRDRLLVVWGMVRGKDVASVLSLFPSEAAFYLSAPANQRAIPVDELYQMAKQQGFSARVFPSVKEALGAAKSEASPSDLILVGGSTFTVAEAL